MLSNQNWTVIEFIKSKLNRNEQVFDFLFFQVGQKGWTPVEPVCHSCTGVAASVLYNITVLCSPVPLSILLPALNPSGSSSTKLCRGQAVVAQTKKSSLIVTPMLQPHTHQITYTLHHINFTGCKSKSDECSSNMCTLYKGISGEFLDLYVLKVRSIKTSPQHQC